MWFCSTFAAETLHWAAVVLFTKIWTAILAVLATACLAGMYLLSTGSSGGFSSADETAVRAVTEAGMAALASDINSSPVSLGPSLLSDTRLRDALEKPAVPSPEEEGEGGLEGPSLQDVFVQVANEGLLNEYPRMSMAITDKNGNILARTGLSPELFDELVKMPAFDMAMNSEEAELLSSTLGGKLHAVKLSRPLADAGQRRLITIRAVELGGGSFFRRVVGTDNPGGLVRDGEVLGDPIGGAKPEDLVSFVTTHMDSIPPEGASGVFMVGDGAEARIGAAARVPGPAGKGKSGTVFVVLSSHTLGSTQQDMASALKTALDSGGLAELNWALVGGLLAISLGLTFYLPFIEYNGPIRRLTGEFNGITEGRQHELYHDTYGGELGRLARAATTAMEALRVSWENELLDSDAELADVAPRRTRSTRSLRAAPKGRRSRSRAHKTLERESEPEAAPEAIDLPSADNSAPIERHAAADAPPLDDAPPAPAFSDDLAASPGLSLNDSSDTVSLADAEGGEDRESYYRRIYDEFVETKVACGEATEGFTYEKFAKKLRKQSDSLLARPEVTDVQFSVYVKDGKAALRAKVIKG
jgi:hypothetical protein